MKKTLSLLAGAALFCLAIPQANATTFTYADHWINWPGYDLGNTNDTIGSPAVDHLVVTVDDTTNYLQSVSIVLEPGANKWQKYDSLFINSANIATTGTGTGWDDWDYLVHDGGFLHDNSDWNTGTVATENGAYRVTNGNSQDYTLVTHPNRIGNPNGIDAGSLNFLQALPVTTVGGTLEYNLSALNIDVTDGFFIAYSEWCANDVIGGGNVPEPATMLLFGTGMIGLIGIGRRRSTRS